MLTGFQKILAACIGQTAEETDQPDDVQRDDEPQTESEITTDDNSVTDAKPTDTPVSEHEETEENDVPSPLEEATPTVDDAPAVPIDESTETHADSDSGIADENSEADGNDASGESNVEASAAGEVSDAAPSDSDVPAESSENTDSIPKDDPVSETEEASPEQEAEATAPADSDVPETETQETDETAPERPPLELGIIEEVYDFVEMFGQSTVSGTEQASASGTDCAGGITKPAIFEHPTPAETAKIDYTLSLPDIDDEEKLFLHFSIGLRDGVVFDDEARQPGGVKFAIEVFDLHNNVGLEAAPDRCFEAVSTECQWTEKAVDLTHHAGKEIVISFLTECNVAGNSNYAWALWGKPQLRKLKQSALRKGKEIRSQNSDAALQSCTTAMKGHSSLSSTNLRQQQFPHSQIFASNP